jgi:hypothetical protein
VIPLAAQVCSIFLRQVLTPSRPAGRRPEGSTDVQCATRRWLSLTRIGPRASVSRSRCRRSSMELSRRALASPSGTSPIGGLGSIILETRWFLTYPEVCKPRAPGAGSCFYAIRNANIAMVTVVAMQGGRIDRIGSAWDQHRTTQRRPTSLTPVVPGHVKLTFALEACTGDGHEGSQAVCQARWQERHA